jgi:glycosyltransferase involved in cell wall biosynthesis
MILFLIVIALLALSVCYALFGSPRSDPWFLKPRPCNQKVEARAVFVGICHNNAKYLPRVTRQIEACGALFQDYKVIVYENDSTDGTTQLLKEWARQNPRVSIQCDLLKVGSAIRDTGSRTQKLAGYRNRVLSMARKLCPGYELTVVVDMDVHWEPETVAHAARDLIRRDDVSFVTANGLWRHKPGVYDYYDIFAYRDRVMNRGAESFRESPDEPVNKFYNRYN